jgi:hypothetical protein
MAYTTPELVRVYLNIEDISTEYDLLTDICERAQKAIDVYTGRVFEYGTATARKFTWGVDTSGLFLYLDEDLCSITSIVTDADGDANTLATSDYITHPRNRTPYHAIEIKRSSDYRWAYTDDRTDAIIVTGKWAYSETAPADIVHAATRLAAYFYRQRDAQVFDVTAMPDAGILSVPQGIPADVKLTLAPYRKHVLW